MLLLMNGPEGLVMMFFLSFILGALVLWIWCLIDVIKGAFKNDITKVIWIILLVSVPVIGVVLYLVMGREQKIDDFTEEL